LSPARKPRRRHLRVLVLVHEELIPPDSIEGLSDEEIADWRTEYDVVSALRELEHEVSVLGVGDDIDVIRRYASEFRPDIAFNLLVEFHGSANYDQHIVSYLELLKLNYTGCNPLGMTLARDKALSKKILAHHHIRVPNFKVFARNRKVIRPKALSFPLFVKSVNEEASLGISRASIVHDDEALAERVAVVQDSVGTDAIAEEFIEGREFYVGVMGNLRPVTFPVWELHIPNLPEGAPNIATRRVKWDLAYQRRLGVRNRRAQDLAPEKEAEIVRTARSAYRLLGLSGYARFDFRMRPDGRFYVLEANPNPELAYGEDFAESAEAGGLSYVQLIQRIVDNGLRYQAEWKR